MDTSFSSRPIFIRSGIVALIAVMSASSTLAVPARPRQLAALSAVRGHVIEALATDTMRPAEKAFLERGQAVARLQAQIAELGASQASSSEVRSHSELLKSDTRQLVDALT